MTKKKGEKPKREVTKRQLSRWQREKKRQRIILGSGIFIVVAILGIVGAGWYINQYRPLHQTVIRVNDTRFDMDYYVKMLKYYGRGQPIEYVSALADGVVKVIERNELVRQEAMKPPVSIIISDDAVDDELKSRDPPLSKDYRDLVRAELLVSKLRDEYFEQKVPLFAEQRHIMAMFLESESQANEIRASVEGGEDFAELASDLDWRPKDILTALLGTSLPEEYAFSSEVGVLSQPIYDEAKTKGVGYWLIKVLERKQDLEEAHIQAMLLGSEEEAQSVRAMLEAGEDFTALAEQFSQDDNSKENGGDFGWLTPGMMSPALDDFAFNPEGKLDTLSEPIRDETVITKGGYWLIKVLEKDDNREISDEDRDLLKGRALNEWVSALWDKPENEVESYLTEGNKAWAIGRAAES